MKKCGCLLFCLLLPCLLCAQDVSDKTRKREQLEQEIGRIDRELSKTSNSIKDRNKALQLTRRKISNRSRIISDLETGLTGLGKQIASKTDNILQLEKELKSLTDDYAYLLQKAYLHRKPQWKAYYILASDNMAQAWRRFRYFQNYAGSLRDQMALISRTRNKLEQEHLALTHLQQQHLTDKQRRQKEVKSLEKEEASQKQMIARMKGSEKQLRQQLENKKKEVARLNREIQRILEAALKEQQSQKAAGKTRAAQTQLSGHFLDNKGKLPWPLASWVVTQAYGQHSHPVFKNVMLPFNNGIDLTAPGASPVSCVFDGTVKQVVNISGYKLCILVQHGDYFTFYCRLASVSVKTGDTVTTGQKLGNLEADGQFHFELWKGMNKQNPEHWLR